MSAVPSAGVYVHLPFCPYICPYCDFDRQATGFNRIDVYLQAVERELAQYTASGATVHSIFFGGGTPSLMSAQHVEQLLSAARRTFRVLPAAEIKIGRAHV